jgi:DNA-binding NtrC family response regulator
VAETILVVEDEEPVRIMLGRLLRSQGYGIVLAANAAEARTVLARIRPEMVVTDIIMPGENGIELRRAIAADWPEIPVLLISGFSDDGPAEFAARTANTAFLPRPFAAEHFLALVAQMLESHAQKHSNGTMPER